MQSGTSRLFFYFLLFLLIGLPAAGYSQSTDSSLVVIKRLIITGNHITKPQVITREMMIQEGDTLEAALLQKVLSRSKDNIMNLGIFNSVDITSASDNVAGITVLVNVAERWYVIPIPQFELVDRNFNEWVRSGDLGRVN
ncbi:MAG: POTRA domain-containing protein, partial [Bacteroidota bacterium]